MTTPVRGGERPKSVLGSTTARWIWRTTITILELLCYAMLGALSGIVLYYVVTVVSEKWGSQLSSSHLHSPTRLNVVIGSRQEDSSPEDGLAQLLGIKGSNVIWLSNDNVLHAQSKLAGETGYMGGGDEMGGTTGELSVIGVTVTTNPTSVIKQALIGLTLVIVNIALVATLAEIDDLGGRDRSRTTLQVQCVGVDGLGRLLPPTDIKQHNTSGNPGSSQDKSGHHGNPPPYVQLDTLQDGRLVLIAEDKFSQADIKPLQEHVSVQKDDDEDTEDAGLSDVVVKIHRV